MSRPKKQGLDYFTKNVNFYQDIKIRKLIHYKGIQAVPVYEILLCKIYASGYYLNWDEDLPFIISEISVLQEEYITDVIKYCLSIGLFDQTMFDSHHILTSRGIQERFFDFCNVAKRKLPNQLLYLLVDVNGKSVNSENNNISSEETKVNSEEIKDNTEETPENSAKSTQSKVKESKEDIDSIESLSSDGPMTGENEEINFLAFMEFFNGTMHQHNAQIPTITGITAKRRGMLNARLKEHGKEALRKAVINAATAPFLNGASDKPFVANFDWIFRPLNFVKVLEGNFNHQIINSNIVSHGTDNNNGYRSRQDMLEGTARIMSELRAEGNQPKKEIPIV